MESAAAFAVRDRREGFEEPPFGQCSVNPWRTASPPHGGESENRPEGAQELLAELWSQDGRESARAVKGNASLGLRPPLDCPCQVENWTKERCGGSGRRRRSDPADAWSGDGATAGLASSSPA